MRGRLKKGAALVAAGIAVAVAGGTAQADPAGKTTLSETAVPGPALDPSKPGFRQLVPGPGWSRVVRRASGPAVRGRDLRRGSLSYFAAITDFQLADEESPERVELLDEAVSSSAWRPQEALHPAVIDMTLRQVNRFVGASPVRQGNGRRARMGYSLLTGDLADSQQYNETLWTRQLLEGQGIDPNSGTADLSACTPVARALLAPRVAGGEARRYTGVQDYSDYTRLGDFYDPDEPLGTFSGWPRYPGLMDRAQVGFQPEGLKVPSYVARGNHDGLVQGNAAANAAFERIGVGCDKPYAVTGGGFSGLDPSALLRPPAGVMFVPPDIGRRSVDKKQIKSIYAQGRQRDAHGFAYVSAAENTASGGEASYYSFRPRHGLRVLSLDTVAEGGQFPTPAPGRRTDEGNIDDPQFRWIESELRAATARDELVIAFAHHPIRSMVSTVTDEEAPPCTGANDGHGHDGNAGCDKDPRPSGPIHDGDSVRELFGRYSHFVSFVAGHTHENELRPCGRLPSEGGCSGGSPWWEINTSAVADWPQQTRLVELMDNRDGTLSFFGTLLDHASPLRAPGSGTSGFSHSTLGTLNRTLSYNDPQAHKAGGENQYGAEGAPEDRNAELLLLDPRRSSAGLRRRLRTCGMPNGSLSGRRVGTARLGVLRRTNQRAFPSFRRSRRSIDRFCIVGGGVTRVGYPLRGLLRRVSSRVRRRVRGRAILALTSSRVYSARGVRAGSSARLMRRRHRRLQRIRIGRNLWYLKRSRQATLLFKVRGGRVRELGLAERRLTGSRRARVRFLKAFRP